MRNGEKEEILEKVDLPESIFFLLGVAFCLLTIFNSLGFWTWSQHEEPCLLGWSRGSEQSARSHGEEERPLNSSTGKKKHQQLCPTINKSSQLEDAAERLTEGRFTGDVSVPFSIDKRSTGRRSLDG